MIENPKKLIFTSGTLPNKSTMEKITGLKFEEHKSYTRSHKRFDCYLATKSKTSRFDLKLNYKNRDFNKSKNILNLLGLDL